MRSRGFPQNVPYVKKKFSYMMKYGNEVNEKIKQWSSYDLLRKS